MAITTLDGVLAGMTPPQDFLKVGMLMGVIWVHNSSFYTSGSPSATVATLYVLAGTMITTYLGQIPWTNPASGYSYLARMCATATTARCLLLMDRLWHNSSL